MKDIINIKEVENIKCLENEYDLQKASLLERKLRLMIEDNPSLKVYRTKLRALIKEYEAKEWSNYEHVSDAQINESDKAEIIVNLEAQFIKRRKESILKKLKAVEMNQQDLGILLGHPKSYMSELINGVSQFTMRDLVIVHRIFGVSLKTLIPTYLQPETRERVQNSILKLNKPKLGLRKPELV